MVAIVSVHQPQLGDIPELDILGDLLGYQMAMIVDDGHRLCILVIKFLRRTALQHEVWVDEFHIRRFLQF